jgi:hypothetical protein
VVAALEATMFPEGFTVDWGKRANRCPTGYNKYISYETADRAFGVVEDRIIKEPAKIIMCEWCDGFHIVRLNAS